MPASRFLPIEDYRETPNQEYTLLPFRFVRLNDDEHVITNAAGEYLVVPQEIVRSLVKHKLDTDSDYYTSLRSRHFLIDSHTNSALDLLTLKIRSRYHRLPEFTALHIFVVTLRCEHTCQYCQVSRQTEDKQSFDMSANDANEALEHVFRSPAPCIKIEFQGGESLLNFELIKHIVMRAETMNEVHQRDLAFVVATNLAVVTDEMLQFCREHLIHISASLDGPEDLHNRNRPRPGKDSYQRFADGLTMARKIVGRDAVSALMTTTAASLGRVRDIIDTYVDLGFNGIFLRPLSPYGFAIRTNAVAAYNTERWLEFYKEGLQYIIELNQAGIPFREFYTAMVLQKMLTSNQPGYVDLMSPAGIGIKGVVYNYDGDVYASDEGRMLAEMGDRTFRIGHVSDEYEDIFASDALLDPIEQSFAGSVPMCSECAFEPFCGSDPVFHHATGNDYVGRKPESGFCKRSMGMLRHIIELRRSSPYVEQLFLDWATK